MDDNLKDVLLVVVGGLLSIFASTLTTYFQNRYERQVARRERKQRHFDEVQTYFFAYSTLYAAMVDHLVSLSVGTFHATPKQFMERIKPLLDRVAQSRFTGIPIHTISKVANDEEKLQKLETCFRECRDLIPILSSFTSIPSDVTTDHQNKLEEMNKLIADVLNDLEKEIDQ